MLEKSDLDFEFELNSVGDRAIELRLSFATLDLVSCFEELDFLVIFFHHSSEIFFKPAKANLFDPVPNGYIAFVDVPPQLKQTSTDKEPASVQASKAASVAVYSSVSLTAISNAALENTATFSLQLLWGIINSMQLVTHLPLYRVTIPANAMVLFNELQLIVSFDYLEKIYPGYARDLGISETAAFDGRFERLGY